MFLVLVRVLVLAFGLILALVLVSFSGSRRVAPDPFVPTIRGKQPAAAAAPARSDIRVDIGATAAVAPV